MGVQIVWVGVHSCNRWGTRLLTVACSDTATPKRNEEEKREGGGEETGEEEEGGRYGDG